MNLICSLSSGNNVCCVGTAVERSFGAFVVVVVVVVVAGVEVVVVAVLGVGLERSLSKR